MALLHNTVIQSAMLGRRMSGLEAPLPLTPLVRAERKNWFGGDHAPDRKSGYVDGSRHPVSWMMAVQDGGLASRNYLLGNGATGAAGALGLNGAASLTGAGNIAPFAGQLIVSAVANLAGSGVITSAAGQAFLNAAANLSGSGNLTTVNLAALGWMLGAPNGAGDTSGTARKKK